MLMYAWEGRYELHDLIVRIMDTYKDTPFDTLLIENKAAGYSVAQEMRRLFGNSKFGIQMYDPKSQDKLARLYSIQHLFAEGLVYAPVKQWAETVIQQCETFPKGKHDDLVDCVSMAMRHMRDSGVLVRSTEWAADMEESLAFVGKDRTQPLYPA